MALNPPIGNGADKIVARVIGPDGSEGGRGVEKEEELVETKPCCLCPADEGGAGPTARAKDKGFVCAASEMLGKAEGAAAEEEACGCGGANSGCCCCCCCC